MFKIIKKQVRPNTSVNFYTATDAGRAHLLENYIKTGKIQVPEVVISPDGLEQSTTVTFASEEVAREWKNDTVLAEIHYTPMEAYCVANGINLQPTIVVGEV